MSDDQIPAASSSVPDQLSRWGIDLRLRHVLAAQVIAAALILALPWVGWPLGAAAGLVLPAVAVTYNGATAAGWLARLENRLYRDVPPPDVVFRLTAPVTVAIDRNRDRQKAGKESDDYVARRHKHFVAPQFANLRAVELDTTQPRADVLRQVRRLLWERLGRRGGLPVLPAGLEVGRHAPLIVEFIGVTGVGRSTLLAAVTESLAKQALVWRCRAR